MNLIRTILIDQHEGMTNAWKKEFGGTSDSVDIVCGDVFEHRCDAIVSPANSFGIMDGGLDGKLRDFFGCDIESNVRKKIDEDFGGELPVGCAIVTETVRADFPFLITAPTMRVPANVSRTLNAYLAMKAALFAAGRHEHIKSIVIPGLCRLSGMMPPALVARQMRIAWERVCLGLYGYSHWREEREFEKYIMGERSTPPEDLEKR